MKFDLLLALDIVHVRELFDDDDPEATCGNGEAIAIDVVADVVRRAIAPSPAILAEVLQQAVVVAQVPAIAGRARTAAVDFVARADHVTRASRARIFAVLTVRAIVTELGRRRYGRQ